MSPARDGTKAGDAADEQTCEHWKSAPVTAESRRTMIAACPNKACNQRYRIKPEMIGRFARCKKCNNRFKVEELVFASKPLERMPIKNDSVEAETQHKDGHELGAEKVLLPSKAKSSSASSNQNSKKKSYKAPALIAFAIFVIFTVLLIGHFHVLRGNHRGLSIVSRDSFGFGEIIINADQIKNMPPVSAEAKFPVGYKILLRERIIKSDETLNKRMDDKKKREFDQAIQEAQRAIFKMMQENQKSSK